jgi:metal-responsive CopG/Arc/MetJ family transcriptional regulator
VKINITLSEELIKEIDQRAKAMYISRSAYIATALSQKMQADDAMLLLPELSKAIQDAVKMQSMTAEKEAGEN